MMTRDDRAAIEGLFQRLAEVEARGPVREPEAEALIRERLSARPAAPYLLAQTVIVQENALAMASERIAELEAEVAEAASRRREGGGGIFGSLFGSSPAVGPRRTPTMPQMPQGAPMAPQGGGFLAGAAQTALGVTGGILLGNAIAGLLAPDPAAAEEPEEDATGGDTDLFGDEGF